MDTNTSHTGADASAEFLRISEGVTVQRYAVRWSNGEVKMGYCSSMRDIPNPHSHSPYGYYDAEVVVREDVSPESYTEEDVELLKKTNGNVENYLSECSALDDVSILDFSAENQEAFAISEQ